MFFYFSENYKYFSIAKKWQQKNELKVKRITEKSIQKMKKKRKSVQAEEKQDAEKY